MGGRLYLVTGGAGFIGSHIVEALLKRGERVVVLDNLSTGRRENLESALRGATGTPAPPLVLEGDILDPAMLRRALRGVTHVIHQAALPSVQRSIEDPAASHEVNATGTLRLLGAARASGVRRFVYASSSSVYGDTPRLPKLESMQPAPLSPYAVSKLAGEHYCRIYHDLYGLETVSLRYFNVFGPRQDPNSQYAAVIPNFVKAAVSGDRPTIFGDGRQSRDFTFVDDAVEANLRACDAPAAAAGGVFNIARGVEICLLELISCLESILDVRIRPRHTPPRPGDVRRSLASIDGARRLLGYRPRVGVEEGLRRTVAWFRG
ncbi:MAG: SDR family oxidoreductase [Acidobacteriota bacterium]